MERTRYLDLVREAMYDELSTAVMGEGSLLDDLEREGAPVRPTAQRFATRWPAAIARLRRLVADAGRAIPGGLDQDLEAELRDRRERARQETAQIKGWRNASSRLGSMKVFISPLSLVTTPTMPNRFRAPPVITLSLRQNSA